MGSITTLTSCPVAQVDKPTAVRVDSSIKNCRISIRGSAQHGTVLDLSQSGLNTDNGKGNEFDIHWVGAATKVLYPGGGTKFNLAPGTVVKVNGVVQQ